MVQYHFKTNEGPALGPIGADEFQQRLEAGEIKDETMVWRSGMIDWTTYATLRANEQRAAAPQPPPLPKKAAAAKVAVSGPGRLPCGTCGKEWPESLLLQHEGQPICGTCEDKRKQDIKNGKKKKGAGSGAGALFLMVVAVVCAGCLAYKVSHYGIRLQHDKVKELTAPSTYGK